MNNVTCRVLAFFASISVMPDLVFATFNGLEMRQDGSPVSVGAPNVEARAAQHSDDLYGIIGKHAA
ncbi:MAG: hypothetical protein DHS20C06_03050 [Hyphobacterium sp.]|nr:MAG: hypothetical protein DHS20C06_03050 [Hyphobacterium sp.]